MSRNRILIVDDEPAIREMVAVALELADFDVLEAENAQRGHEIIVDERPDLVLLDWMLPSVTGIELARRLKRDETTNEVPIIMLTAKSEEDNKIQGLDVGADDYIAKPFNPELLLARVKAVLHRTRRSSSLVHRRNTKTFTFSGWTYDAKHNEARSPAGVQVSLSRRETALLRVLLANPHIPLTREEIAVALDVTGEAEPQGEGLGRAIDVLVGRLRSKIEADPKHPKFLKTERGVGYVFAVDVMEQDT